MSITKRKKKNNKVFYYAEVYVSGVRLASKVFDHKALAHSWHDRTKERLLANPRALKSESKKRTLLEVIKLYKKEKLSFLAFSSKQSISGRYMYLTESPMARLRISELNSSHIDLWIDWLKDHPKVDHSKRKSFVEELKVLGHILHWYHHYKDSSFIVPILRRHKKMCFYKETVSRRPDYYMKPEEVRLWIEWMKSNKRMDKVFWKLASFMVLTGVRVGEACGLKWDAIDLEKGLVNIFRIVGWDRLSKKPFLTERAKTKESLRTLVLPKELIRMLKEIKQEQLEQPEEEFVFLNKENKTPIYPSIRYAFTSGFKALGLPWRGTHICRHTFATMALYATKDLPSVQAHLGHTTPQMTERYAKLAKMISADTAEKTAKVFKLFSYEKKKTKTKKAFKSFSGVEDKIMSDSRINHAFETV